MASNFKISGENCKKIVINFQEAKIFVSSIGNIDKAMWIFKTFWADGADLGSTGTVEQKLNYATFEVVFVSFSGSKKKF